MKNLNPKAKIVVAVALCIYLPIIFFLISLKSETLPFIGSDAQEYKALSESILIHQSFSQNNHPEIFRTPGYPLFLAISKGIFHTDLVAIFLQFLCTVGIALLIFNISKRFFPEKIAAISAIVFLSEPSVIVYTVTIASDILFSFLFLLAIYLIFFKRISYFSSFISGLFLGYATLTRPIAMYFIIIAIIFYLALRLKESDRKIIMLNIAVFCLGFFLLISPWLIRNYKIFGKMTISSLAGYNLFHYNLPEFYSFKNKISPDEARFSLKKELGVDLQNLNDDILKEGQYVKVLGTISMNHLRKDFFSYFSFHLFKTIPFFFSSSIKNAIVIKDNISGNSMRETKYNNISTAIMRFNIRKLVEIFKSEWLIFFERFLWLILIILAIFPVFKKDTRIFSIFFISIILYFAVLTGPVSYVRYRLPVEPFIFILAIGGFWVIMNRNKTT